MAAEALPEGWKQTTLGTVADFVNGDRGENYPSQADRVQGSVPFINTGHIEPNGRLATAGMDYITRESFDRLRSGKVKPGDIVYCLRGSTIGKTARNHFVEGAIASSLVIVRAKRHSSQEYLYYYLTSPFAQQLAAQHDNGSAQPNLSVRALSNYPIALPPVEEQRAIAHILGTLDDKIELNRRMSETLEAMARALFKSWFVDFEPVRAKAEGRDAGLPKSLADLFPDSFEDPELGKIPKGWGIRKISDVCEAVFSGGTPSTSSPHYWGGNVPWLSSGETRGKFIIATDKSITPSGVANSSTRCARSGATVIAGAGQGNTRGQTSMLMLDSYVNQSVVALLADVDHTSDTHLFFDLERRYEEFRRISDGHSSRGSLTTRLIGGLRFVAPSRKIVEAFDNIALPIVRRIAEGLGQSRTLGALRNTLLPKLISGELRVKAAKPFVPRAA